MGKLKDALNGKRNGKIVNEIGWLSSRQTGVGSSDSPILALPSKKVFNKTPVSLYIGKKEPIKPNTTDNPNFRRGHTYEPLAIEMAQFKLGQKIYSPQTDEERWNDFQVRDPGRAHLYADFDGLREDGWVVEVKSPMQRVADSIRENGLKDYYQVQGQHLVHVASVGALPYLGKLPDGCPGVCFVIYECETVSVQVYEIPRNDEMIAAILSNADNFWLNYVEKDIPPTDMIQEWAEVPKSKAKYVEVSGEAWEEALKQYVIANEAEQSARRRLEAAKERIKNAIVDSKLEKIIVNRHKFSYGKQSGRRTLNEDKLLADYPTIDLDKYKIRGEPFDVMRHYGPKDEVKMGDETLDGQLLTLVDEMKVFEKRSVDPEVAVDIFEELRDRAELYMRMLSMEIEGLSNGLEDARKAMIEKVK